MNDTIFNLLLAAFLLFANGFYVASEFALVKNKGYRIDAMAESGRFGARMTQSILKNIEAYLACCQLGITMASLGLGWVGEPTVAALIEPLLAPLGMPPEAIHLTAFMIGFLTFSALHIIIGEQVPKTLAIREPEPVSQWIAYPLYVSFMLFWPLNWALNTAARAILRWIGVKESTYQDILTHEEIAGLIDVSAEHGHMAESQATMIHNLFRFDERTVERIMIPRVECHVLNLDAAPEENAHTIQETQHSRFPVLDGAGSTLAGVILVKDIMDALLKGDEEPWRDLARFTREPMIVPETLKIRSLFDTMRTERSHMSIVIDEYGGFVGIVTMEDLLEEIVGEIEDETDEPEHETDIVRQADHWLADGLTPLADVERVVGFTVEDTFNANTLSGLIMSRLEKIPEIGDVVEEPGFRFTVEKVKDHRVGEVRIETVPTGGPRPARPVAAK
jgi:CBS domain containing-hemolysin-like protein